MAWFGKRQKRLALVLTCADWRLHHRKVDLNARVTEWLGVAGVDYITVPGPDGLILPERCAEWAAALAQAKLLIKAHAPHCLAVIAHQRCAEHPISDEQHVIDAAETAKELKAATNFAGTAHAALLTYSSDTLWGLRALAEY